VLSETADFFYKCDGYYSPEHEASIRWNDPAIGIRWGVERPSLSAKDADAPLLADARNLPVYGQV
jgi:dTDP-4-dehydrorhamnose 3,5-epimerase